MENYESRKLLIRRVEREVAKKYKARITKLEEEIQRLSELLNTEINANCRLREEIKVLENKGNDSPVTSFFSDHERVIVRGKGNQENNKDSGKHPTKRPSDLTDEELEEACLQMARSSSGKFTIDDILSKR